MSLVFDYFLENLKIYYNIEGCRIGYVAKGAISNDTIVITRADNSDFLGSNKDISIENIVWKNWRGVRIPFLFNQDASEEIITWDQNRVIINYDIVASTAYLLSGWNEITNPDRDSYGRTDFHGHVLNKLGITGLPVVNYYFEILGEAIRSIHGDRRKDLWGGHKFSVCLTHDIDTCKSAWSQGSKSELLKGRWLSIPRLLFSKIFASDAWFNFKVMSSTEKTYDAHSTFYFLPQKGRSGKWKNADYDVASPDLKKAIQELSREGHEIGVHGSFGTHLDQEKFQKEIRRIGMGPISGNRFHFLMFDNQKTVSVLEDSGIRHDTSIGFAEHIGFRRGICSPFFLYNFETNRASKVLEIPLVVMDRTLQHRKYMGIQPQEAFEKVRPLIDETIKFNGTFTVLWHNIFFSDYKYEGWRDVYQQILSYTKNKGGLLTTAGEIYKLACP